MNDCKNCYYYSSLNKRCDKFRCSVSDTTIFGSVCKKYLGKTAKNVQCIDCINLNKYSYCLAKKKCIDNEEKTRLKKCRSYTKKKIRLNKKRKVL